MPLVTDDFGIDPHASSNITTEEADAAFLEAVRAKNTSQWLQGDLYASGCLSDQVLNAATFSLKTVQNYSSVCSVWRKSMRLVPVSFSHYEACSALVQKDPNAALKLLDAAYQGGLDRDWTRAEASRLLGNESEIAEMTLVYNAERRIFDAASAPAWLADGYTRTITVRKGG